MASKIIYTVRHVEGQLTGTIVDIVQDDDGEHRMVARELNVDPNYRGGYGRVEIVTPDEEQSVP